MKATKAVWKGTILAESNDTILVEGNPYFPPSSVNIELFKESEMETTCPWKGVARYRHIEVNGEQVENAAWYYPDPNPEASRIKDYCAFWKGVEILKETKEERNEKIFRKVTGFFNDLDEDSLVHLLPEKFIHDLSFFNFDNSTTACFYTDQDMIIRKVNPTFQWTFNQLGDPIGSTLWDLLGDLEMPEEEQSSFQEKLLSHGWVNIPNLKAVKGDAEGGSVEFYYSLDVAVTKHGDLDSLSGIQGQFIDITPRMLLSKRIEEKNEELGRFNKQVQDLLDNTGQGFLAFGGDFEIHDKYSKACLTFFDRPIETLNFLELIFPDDIESGKSAEEVLNMLFSGIGEMAMVEDLLPKEIELEKGTPAKRILKLEYKWIRASGANDADKIMVILTDVTVEKELESQLEADEERNRTLVKIAADRDGFLEFLRELERLFQNVQGCLSCGVEKIDSNELFRHFHTIKGGAASYALRKVADEAHRIESGLEGIRSGEQTITLELIDQIKEDTERLKGIVDTSLREFSQLIPEEERQQKDRVYRVTSSKLKQLQERLLKQTGSEFTDQIEACTAILRLQPISSVLKKFAVDAKTLADNLGKQVDIQLSGLSIEIDHDLLSPLFTNLTHLVRNSIDHGLETPDVRNTLGKPETGTLKIDARQKSNDLVLVIADDGRGIDGNTIKQIALNKKIITEEWAESASQNDLIKLIFAPGFSTKEAVSDVSGRGVGMDAVKSAIEALNGKMKIQTKIDHGSTFAITIPNAC